MRELFKRIKFLLFFILFTLFIFSTFNVYATSPVPIGHWTFDGNSNDISGNDFHGQVYGASLAIGKDDLPDTAYSFDGDNDGIVLTGMDGVITSGEFSVSMWVNIDDLSSNMGSFPDTDVKGAFFYGLNPYFRLGIGTNNKLLLQQKIGGGWHNTSSVNVLDTGRWIHIVATHNQSTGEDSLYIDGEKVNNYSTSSTGDYTSYYSSSHENAIGARKYSSTSPNTNFFDGRIDELQIFDTHLTQAQVQELFNSSQGGGGEEDPIGETISSIGHWTFDGNSNDISGNDFHGQVYGASLAIGKDDLPDTAYSFDGDNDGIVLTGMDGVITSGEFSVSMWVNIDDLSSNMGSFPDTDVKGAFFYGLNPYFRLGIGTNNKLLLQQKIGGGWHNTSSVNVLDTGRWIHIVATHNQSTGEDSLYIDGEKVNNYSTSSTGDYTSYYSSSHENAIGARKYSSTSPNTNFFDGRIDELQIFDTHLTQAQVQELYNSNDSEGTNDNTSSNTNEDSTNEVISNPTVTHDTSDTNSRVSESNQNIIAENSDESVQDANEQFEGDPVILSKGEFIYENTLMSIPGVKIPYELKLNYKNQTYYNGPVGINWDHNYNMYLKEEENGNVIFYNGKLGIFRFIKNGSSFDYNKGLRATLQNNTGVYSIRYDNGDIYTFNSTNAKIQKVTDRYGNYLIFTYANDLLSQVTDTLGRAINYNYYDHNRLKEVVDFNGRKVEFTYFDVDTATGSTYDLQNVTINNGNGATKTISFEYATEGDNESNHNITKLIDAKGQVYVENTYDTGDRVSTQKFGEGTLIYTYELNGNSIVKNTVIDKVGNKAEYTYDANHNNIATRYYNQDQTSYVDYFYDYNADGYIIQETKPRGNGYTYVYDNKGNLLEKRFKTNVDALNGTGDIVTTYTYNSLNQVLVETKPNGTVQTNTYDVNGNRISKTIAGLKTYSGATYSTTSNYSYLPNGLIDIVLDGEGNQTDFNYSSGQVIEIVKGMGIEAYTGSFTYNDYGNILTQTDGEGYTQYFGINDFHLVGTGTTAEGIVTSYKYDENNNKIEEIKYLSGGIDVHSYFYYDLLDNMTGSLIQTSSGETLLTRYVYDNNNNLIEKQTGSGAVYTYDYNEFGLLETETVVLDTGDTSKNIITSYAYDDNNNLMTKTDALGNITTYIYDLYDRLIKQINSEGTYTSYAYNKDGTISTKAVYDSSDTILSKVEYLYDGIGNRVKQTSYTDTITDSGAIITSTVYDKNAQVTKQIDGKGNETINVYDNIGRLDSTFDALGNKIEYYYDKRDLVIRKNIVPNTETGEVTWIYAYDRDSRLLMETDALNNDTTYSYNKLNQVISKIDGENNRVDYTYDYSGNVSTETKYLSGETVSTSYTYDNRGNMLSITDGESNTTYYEYDGVDRNIRVIYADTNELIYTYDKNSNLLTQKDPNGTITMNTYDSLNRLVERNIQTGTGTIGVIAESYTYDDLGRLVSSLDDTGRELSFQYDDIGRLIAEAQSGAIVHYEYDENSNLVTITHPDSRETVYTYDAGNRNNSISFSGSMVATYSYTGVVNDSIAYGNGQIVTKTYDELLRLATLNNGIKSYDYTYDSVDSIISDSDKSYSYDDIYRLIEVIDTLSGSTLESFSYDDAGNRISDEDTSYEVNDLNQYTTLSGTTLSGALTYDANGNIIDNGKYSFQYDYKNRLVKVSDENGEVAEYFYDVLGRRYKKNTNDKSIEYVYSNRNVLEEEKINAVGTMKKVYINGVGLDNLVAFTQEEPDLSVSEQQELYFCEARVLPYESEFNTYSYTGIVQRCNDLSASGAVIVENTYYFHKNHLGSIIGITNEGGDIVSEYEYDVFGKAELVGGYDIGNTRLYTGREYDDETGLYYLRARYYDAELGRFISRDPIGQLDDVNLYAYVGNNPVMFVDLMGTEKQTIGLFVLDDVAVVLYEASGGKYVVDTTIKNARDLHYLRNVYLIRFDNIQQVKDAGYILQPDWKNRYHKSNSESNVKYMDESGHQEVIYTVDDDELDYSDIDGPTYNYGTNYVSHFLLDMFPYYIGGNTSND